ncbi:MAG TPA: hypothetical protein VE972_07910 [Conexibacter sp.]|nr:hypothetical protein [Conexibacter sp.]
MPSHASLPNAPEIMRPLIDRIVELVEQQTLRPAYTEDRVRPYDPPALDRPSVVSVLGNHGSGKSTVLYYACRALATHPDRYVLPIVKPEHFAHGDQLFGWTLAGIDEWLNDSELELGKRMVTFGRRDLSLTQLVSLLRRQEALARSEFKERPPVGHLSPDEWATGLTAVTTAGLQLWRGWRLLLDNLGSRDDADGITQLVVPVDDADQAPTVLPDLFRDLRWLTSHPKVSALLCANDISLTETLAPHFPDALEPALRTKLAAAAKLKVLPRHLRLMLEPLPMSDRLEFSPIGENGTILERLAEFPLQHGGTLTRTLADYFQLNIRHQPRASGYASMLPDYPRELEQLWHELRDLRSDEQLRGTIAAAQLLTARAIETAHAENPKLPTNTIAFATKDTGPAASEFIDFRFGILMGLGRTLTQTPERTVGLRRIDGNIATLDTGEEGEQGATRAPGHESQLPARYVESHRFVSEFSDSEDLSEAPLLPAAYYGPRSNPGGESWAGAIVVHHKRQATDNSYLLIPAWESHHDVMLYTAAWNQLVDVLIATPQTTVERWKLPRWIEWVICVHAALVCEVHRSHCIQTDLLPADREELASILSGWDRKARFAQLEQSLRELYAGNAATAQRQRDFDFWVEAYLPLAADAAFSPPAIGKTLLALRSRVLRAVGRKQFADRRCARTLAGLITGFLAKDWVQSRIDLLAHFDPEEATGLRDATGVAKEDRGRENLAFAAALEQRGVPQAVVARVFLEGIDDQLGTELREAGIPNEAIRVLSQHFPPVEVKGMPAAPVIGERTGSDVASRHP